MNNLTQEQIAQEQTEIGNGFLTGKAAVSRAKEIVLGMTVKGSDENKDFGVQSISGLLNKSPFACAALVSAARKSEKRGEIVVTANIDDSRLKFQVAHESLAIGGVSFSEVTQAQLPAAKVNKETEETIED